ncbi:BspA family leucine-rich repeat surface protein [Maribellus mangrovi]|uniref:BspA family leucine-rich repeat surface protein n=1 Tax=Maribellus mangrovi TaxID=3133146 RepID=UPI0030EF9B0F
MKLILVIYFVLFALNNVYSKDLRVPTEKYPTIVEDIDSSLAAQLRQAIDNQVEQQNIKGLSAAVLLPNDSIWLGASGISDPVNYDTIRSDMLFRTGSVGKTMTAAVILQLVDDGKLHLDDSLYQWLPAFPYIDTTITIKQLLNHTSGVYNMGDDPSFQSKVSADLDKLWTQEERLSTFVHEPYFPPGMGYHYSNTNYCLLSMIIEEATGLYFPHAMNKYLGDNNRLNHTYFTWSDTIPGDFAHPWFDLDGDGILEDIHDILRTSVASVSFGNGGVISTAENMARWMKYLMQGKILEPVTMEQMLTFGPEDYGLGVSRFSIFNTEFRGHSGWSPGVNTEVYYSPVDSICIAVMANDDNANSRIIFDALCEVLYPRLTFDNSRLDLGDFSLILTKFDTTFFVSNSGAKTDSVFAYIENSGTTNSSAMSVSPSEFELAPEDSQVITLEITPGLFDPGQYTAWLRLESKFSPTTPLISKVLKFNITGTTADPYFYLDENSITIKCENCQPGDTGTVNGITYEAVDRKLLEKRRDEGADLTILCTSLVPDMDSLFYGMEDFNQDISSWDVSRVSDMTSMFFDADSFNQDIGSWDVRWVRNMSSMFYGTRSFNQDIGAWDVRNVILMPNMFYLATSFNQDIGAWDVGLVTNMEGMFGYAVNFNQEINSWDVSNVRNMAFMFGATFLARMTFNQPLDLWDVSKVTNMHEMFRNGAFNQNISSWNVGNVTDMGGMFESAGAFNQDIGGWNVGKVTNMSHMFKGTSFNQKIGEWDVSSVTNMNSMFYHNNAFNQNIGSWDVGRVEDMGGIFHANTSFNQDIGSWDVSNVRNMSGMFSQDGGMTMIFNQDLSNWCVENIPSEPVGFAPSLQPAYYPKWGTCPLQVGIDDLFTAESFSVYPNPTPGIVSIEDLNEPVDIKIYSTNGQLLKSFHLVSNTIDISEFPAGFYIMNLTSKNKSFAEKIIKE